MTLLQRKNSCRMMQVASLTPEHIASRCYCACVHVSHTCMPWMHAHVYSADILGIPESRTWIFGGKALVVCMQH